MKPSIALVLMPVFPGRSRPLTSEFVGRVGEWTITLRRVYGGFASFSTSREETYHFGKRRCSYDLVLTTSGGAVEDATSALRGGEDMPREVIEAARMLLSTGLCRHVCEDVDLGTLVHRFNRRGVTVVMQETAREAA